MGRFSLLLKNKARVGVAALVTLSLLLVTAIARANDQIVSNCSDSGLRTAVAQAQSTGGGTITFSCGATATIVLQNGTLPNITSNTTVDGGGTITISGNNPSGGS